MSGFDNGSPASGVVSQAKQYGAILRGFGPPAPTAGLTGDLYIDTQTKFLYVKRQAENTDPWGNYLFQVPDAYADGLKWFSGDPPSNAFGVTGDCCLSWASYSNYGLGPSVYGPKAAYGWPEIGEGLAASIDATYAGYALSVGASDEGAALPFSSSTQLIVVGALDEYILAIPVAFGAGVGVSQLGVMQGPASVPMNLNPLYTTTNTHAV